MAAGVHDRALRQSGFIFYAGRVEATAALSGATWGRRGSGPRAADLKLHDNAAMLRGWRRLR
jgi:hypothetical protein